MPTFLYGLTLPTDPRPAEVAEEGIGGAPHRHLEAGEVTAIVCTLGAKPEPTLDAVRAHDAVLRRHVSAGATVAAVRFGQWFPDDAACVDEVRRRAPRVAALLRERAGCVEMRVLLPVADGTPVEEPSAATSPGRAYLESLRARGQVAPHVALRPMLGPAVRQERVEGFASRDGSARGVAFAHLVHRDQLAEYRAALRAHPALAGARIVGPLPLYSCADAAP